MKNNAPIFSFSVYSYGDVIMAYDEDDPTPLYIGANNNVDRAEACRVIAANLLDMAHRYDHAKDFCAPEFDMEQREKQLDELRKTMTPMYEKSF